MDKISVSVSMDRAGALLAGRVVKDFEIVEICLDDFGSELWPDVVRRLILKGDGPHELTLPGNTPSVVSASNCPTEATPEALREIFQQARDKADKEAADKSRRVAEALAAYLAAPIRVSKCVEQFYGERYEYQKREAVRPHELFAYGIYTSGGYEPRQDLPPEIRVQVAETYEQAKADAEVSNAPHLIEIERLKVLARERAEAKAKTDKEAADKAAAQIAAKRLESGRWEHETSSYNQRRYGGWWCAKVTFPDGPKPEFAWGDSTAKWGDAGVLSIACAPGEIVAYGQKDNRTGDSEIHYLHMQPDGRMLEVTKAQAYKIFRDARPKEGGAS